MHANSNQAAVQNEGSALRVWPGVVLAAVQILFWFVVPIVVPERPVYGFLGALAAALGIVLWWVFFSRVPWLERLGVVALMIVGIYSASWVVHVSMATIVFMYALMSTTFALVVGAIVSRGLTDGPRRAVIITTMLLACGVWSLVRSEGVSGARAQFAWRWTPTPEEQLLAQGGEKLIAPPAAPVAASSTETPGEQPATKAAEKIAAPPPVASKPLAEPVASWPGFRGPHRDSVIPGIRIETNWAASPPVELWRRPVGPGWSSFAVRGNLLYTQEQRGESEMVTCYNTATGKPVWEHRDATRFWEAGAGAGPRGTPTLHNGRVYTFGATGILNALDAATGTVAWSRNVATDAERKVPQWGFSSSPLIVENMVIVAASGRLVAYDITNGERRWMGPQGGAGYSSPHLLTVGDVAQVLLLSGTGAVSVAPADGSVLWQHKWEGSIILQPAMTADGDILLTVNEMVGGAGTRRLHVAHGSGGWTVEERWTSRGLKPFFNDFVVHNGHAFGFDGSILACIDLKDGERKWKGGRYGQGQLVLLAEQDLLLVLSEEGELALVSATPDGFKELARVSAIEGKTWNHPVLVGDMLLVRNDREMAAFRLSLVNTRSTSLGLPGN